MLTALFPHGVAVGIYVGALLVVASRTARISVATVPDSIRVKNRYRTYMLDARDVAGSGVSAIGGNGPQAIQLLTCEPQWFGLRRRVTIEASASFDVNRRTAAASDIRAWHRQAKHEPRGADH